MSLPGALAPAGALCTRCGIVVRTSWLYVVTATFIHMLLSNAALLCCFLPHCHCTLLYTILGTGLTEQQRRLAETAEEISWFRDIMRVNSHNMITFFTCGQLILGGFSE